MNDREHLARLQEKYGSASGGDIFNDEFRQVAEAVFSGDRRPPPYSGVSTLLDAPHQPLDTDMRAGEALDIALIGVPMDLGVTNRNGSRFGPRAVRSIDRVGPYHHLMKCAPLSQAAVADAGDVPFRSRFDLDMCTEDIEQFYKQIVGAGIRPLSVGGDHSISFPILKALGEERPVGMIQIDAHCDTAGSYEGQKFHHGGPFRNAVLAGVLDPKRSVQIGIRGATEYLWEFSYESGMTVIHSEDVHRRGVDDVVAQAREVVGDGPVYISFDVDGLDPAFTPGTGTPELGGLSTREALMMMAGFAGLNVVGGDVVEVAPQYDATTNTAQVGAQMLFEILCLMVRNPEFSRKSA